MPVCVQRITFASRIVQALRTEAVFLPRWVFQAACSFLISEFWTTYQSCYQNQIRTRVKPELCSVCAIPSATECSLFQFVI